MIHLNSLLELEPIEEFEMVEDSAYQDDIEWLRETNLKDKRIRQVLAAFTGILVIAAPVISALYPSTWTLILSTALAFTIGTNLLISVVTVKVESKAQKLEERMAALIKDLNETADRMSSLHDTLNIANIPGAIDLFETVKNEFMPGFKSLEDLDLRLVTTEIRKVSEFAETLDRDKLLGVLSQFTKEGVEPGSDPYSFEEEEEEDDFYSFEEDFEDDVYVFDESEVLAKLGI